MSHTCARLVPLLLLGVALRAGADEPAVSASFAAAGRVSTDEAFALELSRPLSPAEGQVAVLVGATDVTSLFRATETGLRLVPVTLPLPVGRTELVVYRVAPEGAWRELARFPLEVVSARDPWRTRLAPSLDVALKAQVAEGHRPDDNAPARAAFQDVTGQLGLKGERARGDFGLEGVAKVVGVSFEPEALRFSLLGAEAPKVDLAGYSLALRKGRLLLRTGDLTHGSHRHLMQGFASRGLGLSFGLGPAVDLSLAAVAGSKLVGWDNPLGVGTPEHRLLAATLGLELVPSQPGRVRLEAVLLDGSELPIASYNQGVVNDAQESLGVGLRLLASDPAERVRLDGGWARSRFENPADPLLEQGTPTVQLAAATADARYADARVDLLRGVGVGGGRTLTLGVSFLHERLDPLYGTVGARLSRDQLSNTLGASLVAGEAAAQYTYGRSEDNLDRVPSILTTFTRRHALDVTLPFTTFRRADAEPSAWLPLATYSFARVTQAGDGVPPDSGFTESHVPDQTSDSHALNVAWQGSRASFAWSLARSAEENRQPGRERVGFVALTNGFTLGFSGGPSFDATLELALERNEVLERAEVQELRRIGAGANWRLPRGFGFTGLVSLTRDEAAEATEATAAELDLQASWRRALRGESRKPVVSLFVRYARQRARLRSTVFATDDDRSAWQVSTGLSLTAF
jgi:hypothetical protein